jgi:hypothetical protein
MVKPDWQLEEHGLPQACATRLKSRGVQASDQDPTYAGCAARQGGRL